MDVGLRFVVWIPKIIVRCDLFTRSNVSYRFKLNDTLVRLRRIRRIRIIRMVIHRAEPQRKRQAFPKIKIVVNQNALVVIRGVVQGHFNNWATLNNLSAQNDTRAKHAPPCV